MHKLESINLIQIGLIVKDVEKTAKAYAGVFGIPVPEIVPIADDSFAHTTYHGQASTAKGRGAFFDLGPVQMELIEPVGSPSTWEEFLRTRGEGIHHLAFETTDIQATRQFLDRQGFPTIQHGGWDGGQYAYVDGSEQLGTILELLHFDN